MAKLGAEVVATDLGPNLPLLRDNCTRNGVAGVAVLEHRWGSAPAAPELQQPFDVIVACGEHLLLPLTRCWGRLHACTCETRTPLGHADVMYVAESVPDLLASLLALSHASTTLLIAHGRNRPAEPAFRAAAAAEFHVELLPPAELDDVFQCNDVDVLRLLRRGNGAAADSNTGAETGGGDCERERPA